MDNVVSGYQLKADCKIDIIFNRVQNNEQIFSSYIYLHALKKLGLDIIFCQKHELFITLMWMIKYFNYLDVNLPTRSPQYQTEEICLSPQNAIWKFTFTYTT